MFVDIGDSGAPVFTLLPGGTTVELNGIVFLRVGSPGDYDAWISNLHQIEQDLGPLLVSTLRVEIDGPSVVRPNTTCMWSAHFEGAVGYPSFQWQKEFQTVGTSEELFLNTGTDGFNLTVSVIDSWGQSAQDMVTVTIDDDAPACGS